MVMSVFDQLDVRRRCLKIGQILIEERWNQNSSLYHSCFHLSAIRFFSPKMNFSSSVLHIVVEPRRIVAGMLVLKTQSSSC